MTNIYRPLIATAIVGGIVTAVNGIPANAVRCCWFAMCIKTATHFETHPILTYVPACDDCPKVGR